MIHQNLLSKVSWRLNVIDGNEKPKIRLPQTPFVVIENSPVNTVIGSITIFDEDYDDTHTTHFKITYSNGKCSK